MNLIIHTDGGSRGNPGTAGIGINVMDEAQNTVFEASQLLGTATNNEAEYTAFKVSLEWLLPYSQQNQVDQVTWQLDSKLVVEQLNKQWKIKEPRMSEYAHQIWSLLEQLPFPYSIQHVRREFNKRADELANQAMDLA